MARVSDKVPLAGRTKSITSTNVGSLRESEAEDSSVSSKDQFSVYLYRRFRRRSIRHLSLLGSMCN